MDITYRCTSTVFSTAQLRDVDVSDKVLYENKNKYTPHAMVYKDISPLCSSNGRTGYGVFAARDLPKGTPVTFYAGQVYTRKHKHAKKGRKSDYVYSFSDGIHMIDGLWWRANGPWWTRQGIGHLLNDNIHVHATGLNTNASFFEVDMVDEQQRTHRRVQRLIIVTTRDVACGEELFVSYSLGYWLSRKDIYNELGESPRQWLENMNDLIQDFIDRMYAHGRSINTGCNSSDEACETLPFIGQVKCVDLYDNRRFCPTTENYDFYFETVVREGAFDLVFEFDNAHDMICCDWHEDVSSDMNGEEEAVLDGEELPQKSASACSKECRLTVHYILDTFSNTWLQSEVSCWQCGRNIEHLCFVKD